MQTPLHLHIAYNWVLAANELDTLAYMRAYRTYAKATSKNAAAHDVSISADDIVALREWLRRSDVERSRWRAMLGSMGVPDAVKIEIRRAISGSGNKSAAERVRSYFAGRL